MKETGNALVWREVCWSRPIGMDSVTAMLSHLASISPRGTVAWETRCLDGRARHLIGIRRESASRVMEAMGAHGDIQFAEGAAGGRMPVTAAVRLKASSPALPLDTDGAEQAIKSVLSAMASARGGMETVVQVILGPPTSPRPLPKDMAAPKPLPMSVLFGAGSAPAETRRLMAAKAGQHGFMAEVRIGASGEQNATRLGDILGAIRMLEGTGVRIRASRASRHALDQAREPIFFPQALSVSELACLFLLPTGTGDVPGMHGLHPKPSLPPGWYKEPAREQDDRAFAMSLNASRPLKLSIAPKDALEHTVILGPTGSGKSTAMEHLILADIRAGRGVLVIDPKADLVDSVLERVPDGRAGDVIVLDPGSARPAGFNPLALAGGNPELLADTVLSVLKEIWADSWGVRTADILNAALLTLAKARGATLLWVQPLLENEGFRRQVLQGVQGDHVLARFWEGYNAMSDRERNLAISPVLNKLRNLTMRRPLRCVLGQAQPKFSLQDIFRKRKIVLVPLNKGLSGGETARLLGSLVVGMAWNAALSRAGTPQEERRPAMMYIDELQDYLSLPTDLADALAQARGLGLAITMAHQYRGQLPALLKSGIDTNARNKIIFGLNAADAREMAAMAPGLEPQDFMALPRHGVYASFQQGGRGIGWIRGETLPPAPAIRPASELREASMKEYGRPAGDVEREFLEQTGAWPAGHGACQVPRGQEKQGGGQTARSPKAAIGRRKI